MDQEPLAFLTPSPEAVEKLRALILEVHGITVDGAEAHRIGTFLLQAAVLLAAPRPPNGAARPSDPPA